MHVRVILIVLAFVAAEPVLAGNMCANLTSLHLPQASITSAELAPAGPLKAPAAFGGSAGMIPSRCVIQGVARPSRDSEIRFELWIPTSGWNGKYLQVGNGGWAGSIDESALAEPLRRGYVVAGTDDGHRSDGPVPGAPWAVGHPEKLIDFGYRAVHVTSVQAKAIVHAYFGRDPSRSYFNGCSDGGREALMEAQRYPEDFVGIIAGAPANNWSHLFTGFVWNEQALAENPIPANKLLLIQAAALAKCDTLDGVKDGLIEDPRACTFDPVTLLCKSGDSADCLTAGQLISLRKIYSGPKNPRTGESIFPGYVAGTEAVPGNWGLWILPPAIQASFGNSYYGQAVYEQTKWDFGTLNFDSDVQFGDSKAGAVLNATNPDLRSFRANGGKLIQYHGWGDSAISPYNSIAYYESVREFLGRFPDARGKGEEGDFYRLFMVPGMSHCSGGAGPNDFGNGRSAAHTDADHDILAALELWVEHDTAPAKLIASGTLAGTTPVPFTHPLCPYPQTAQYSGEGDTTRAENFICAAPGGVH